MFRIAPRLGALALFLAAGSLTGCDALDILENEQESRGLVEAVDATSITLNATRYAVDAQTVFEDLYASISDARVGDEIEITSDDQAGTRVAREASKE